VATVARGWSALRVFLEMIKIEHSIFALPFAMIGMMWGARSVAGSAWPGAWTFLWIVVAMVAGRSAAMAYNRIADREVDALNPRTKTRAIPAGLLRLGDAWLCFGMSVAVFLFAAAMLNPLALALSPVALLVTLGYSWCKRFTPLAHFALGLSLGIAPAAAWIAVTGALAWQAVALTVAVGLWTAGFDVIYSMQDASFDRDQGLRSLPETLGARRALAVSRLCHLGAIAALTVAGMLSGAGPWFYGGVAVAGALLAYEQSLVRPGDLSRVNLAFFTLNGFVSIGLFAFALMDVLV
jgi:4-hydroxybenzoate polyprenyltransferase